MLEKFKDQELKNLRKIQGGNINSRVGDNSSLSFSYGLLSDNGYVPRNNYTKHSVS